MYKNKKDNMCLQNVVEYNLAENVNTQQLFCFYSSYSEINIDCTV